MTEYKYTIKDFKELPVILKHIESRIDFYEEYVDVKSTLHMRAKKNVDKIVLNADELEIFSVKVNGNEVDFEYDKKNKKLIVQKAVLQDEEFYVENYTRCFPSDTKLEGIYKDKTIDGAPQQYMSQCQQLGFQRIMPVFDDCRAKCTMKTTLTGDIRYTHLISNGNISKETNPKGVPVDIGDGRQSITYVNDIPMAPYLFIAAAGTWDVLKDKVIYDNGRSVDLEYLVPPGQKSAVKIPMEILKKSILWIKQTQDYEYTRDTYRTITMDKSDFGGMENVGNTTIVTSSALIDEYCSDSMLKYAHAVIVHEFEHNQCGSETTMETPFDIWLNEAYTVFVENQFMADMFGKASERIEQVESIRMPLLGPLAIEDSGYGGKILRDGFNHPDDLIDGVTYVKSPEVIRMLNLMLGKDKFKKAKTLYFERYKNKNANTDQFFECFEEIYGKSLENFKNGWIKHAGYPKVIAKTKYEGNDFIIELTQTQKDIFEFPFEAALVDKNGNDYAHKVFYVKNKKERLVFKDVKKPLFASLNRDYSFYGTFEHDVDLDTLIKQALLEPNQFNRVEAIKTLTDICRKKIIDNKTNKVDDWWLELMGNIINEELPSSLHAKLLTISEEPLDRDYANRHQDLVFARECMVKAVNEKYYDKLVDKFNQLDTYSKTDIETGINDRMLKNALLALISADDSPRTHKLLVNHYKNATTANDKISALAKINDSSHPRRNELLEEAYSKWHTNLNGYGNYLRIISSRRSEDVFDMIENEMKKDTFDIKFPTHARSLILPMAFNRKMIWTDKGIEWVKDNVIKFSKINTTLASRLLSVLGNSGNIDVKKQLEEIKEKTKDNDTIQGQIKSYLAQ